MMPDVQSLSMTHDERTAADLAEFFRALGDTSRVRILMALLPGDLNVGALAEQTGVSMSAVSHHLRGLRQLRLVRARRDGRHVFYSLDDAHVATLLEQGLDHVRHG
jgi:DNA-binding transcriptional ArsR family regulator